MRETLRQKRERAAAEGDTVSVSMADSIMETFRSLNLEGGPQTMDDIVFSDPEPEEDDE